MFGINKLTNKNVLGIIYRIKSSNWKRVNNQPCIHTFYGRYYINLCLWNKFGKKTISIDVDDVRNGRNDVVFLEIQEGDARFQKLLKIYLARKAVAANAVA